MILDATVKVSREALHEGRIAASMLGMNVGEYLTGALRAAAKIDIERANEARKGGLPVPAAAWDAIVPRGEPEPRKRWEGYEERQERNTEIVRLRRTGLTCRAISEQLGVPLGTVTNVIQFAKRSGTMVGEDGA